MLIRSIALNPQENPIFKDNSDLGFAIPPSGPLNIWTPSNFHIANITGMAVSHLDSKKVFIVYMDRNGGLSADGRVDVDIWLTKTDDATADTVQWSTPTPIAVEGDQIFPWLESDKFGRLHLLFLDTRNNPDQDDASGSNEPDGLFDAYYAMSDDDGQTWTHFRLSPQSFNAANGMQGQWFGDYLGMAVSGNRVYPFYQDIAGTPPRSEAFTNVIVFGEADALAGFTVNTGTVISGDVSDVNSSNDSHLQIRSPQTIGTLKTVTTFHRNSQVANPTEIDIRIESHSSEGATTAIVRLKDWISNTFKDIATYNVSEDVDDNFWQRGIPEEAAGASPDFDYVRDSDGRIELQIEHQQPIGPSILTFDSLYDFVQIVVLDDE